MTTKQIKNLLSTKKFKSLKYQKLNGEIATYYSAQFGVHRELIKGAPSPSDSKSWSLFWDKKKIINLWCKKEGENIGKFRSFKLDNIISISAEGSIFDV